MPADGRVGAAGRIIRERRETSGSIELPLLLKTRAAAPTAVFCVPLVLSNNAAAADGGIGIRVGLNTSARRQRPV